MVSPVLSLVDALKKGAGSWDPSKHPRDRDGQFIELGDFVHAYAGPGIATPEATGQVVAGHFDTATGRMFIGVKDANNDVRWYRPKQIEGIHAKAKLSKPPTLPLPSLPDKPGKVQWDQTNIVPSITDDVWSNGIGGKPMSVTADKVDNETLGLAGLGPVDKPAPSIDTTKPTPKVAIPKGKTPDDVLRLIVTSWQNKVKSGSVGPYDSYDGGEDEFKAKFEDMLADTDFQSASKKLAKIMTAAKLGGKQRKRYNDILSQKHGSKNAMSVSEIHPPDAPTAEKTEAAQAPDAPPDALMEWEKELLAPDPYPAATQAITDNYLGFIENGTESDKQHVIEMTKSASPSASDSAKLAMFQAWALGTPNLTGADMKEAGVPLPPSKGAGPAPAPASPGASSIKKAGPPPAQADPDYVKSYKMSVEAGGANLDFVVKMAAEGTDPMLAESAKEALKQAWAAGTPHLTTEVMKKAGLTWFGPKGEWHESPAAPAAPVKASPFYQLPPGVHVSPNDQIYGHFQGSTIVIEPGGKVTKYLASGKKSKTSATAEKLMLGHGAWKYVGTGSQVTSGQQLTPKGVKHSGHSLPGHTPVPAPDPNAAPAATKGINGWDTITPSGGGVNTPVGVVGPGLGNQLVNQNNNNGVAGQAKASIQTQIAKRLKGKVTAKQLADSVLDSHNNWSTEQKTLASAVLAGKAPAAHALKKDGVGNWRLVSSAVLKTPTKDELEHALLENVTNQMIANWASSSNDTNPRSLALQHAAVDEFGLKDTYDWPNEIAKAKLEYNKHQKLLRAFLRAMYENTQDWAKANNVKKVRLRRGSDVYAGPVGSVATVQLRPMSSFTTNSATTSTFGNRQIEAYVPIEWIIGNAATGYGCMSEYEWVVLGGKHKVRVTK